MISIVICTYNRADALKDTLYHLSASNMQPDEIIIIDQTKDQDKQNAIIDLCNDNAMRIKYYHIDVASLAVARNVGIEKVKNDIVVFMDDDVRVQSDTLNNIELLMDDETVSMIAGINLNAKKNTSNLGALFFKKKLFNTERGYVTKAVYGRLPEKIETQCSTEWAMGYFFVVRKSLIQKWNICWDNRFISYSYAEDLDFSYRYHRESMKEGYRCVADSSVAVHHMASQEWRVASKAATYMQVVNREYLSYKFGWPWWSRLMTRWANFGVFLERVVKHDNYRDMFEAQLFCDKYRKDIKKGILHVEEYLK